MSGVIKFKEIKASKMSFIKRKLVHGIGINDADYLTTMFTPEGKELKCPYYRKWIAMFDRCYSARFQRRQPSYKGCSVCNEWHLFSNFKKWMQKQDWEGKDLDKDIIKHGNKVYSPDNCVFVERYINNLLLNNPSIRGELPQGVTYHKKDCTFHSRIKKCNRHIYLGSYSTPEEASERYIQAKYEYIIQIACNQSDVRVHDGLIEHARLLLNE